MEEIISEEAFASPENVKKKDYIRLICSLLLKEKSQKKNIGHNAVDRKSSMN